MDPVQVAARLYHIAESIDKTENPSRGIILAKLREILASLEDPIEKFVQRLMDGGADKYPPIALQVLGFRTGKSISEIEGELGSYGVELGTDPDLGSGDYGAESGIPEYASIGNFVKYLLDDERGDFSAEDLQILNRELRKSIPVIRRELELLGFGLQQRGAEKKPRGFQSPDLDRWYGPGSIPSHGGSGFSNIE